VIDSLYNIIINKSLNGNERRRRLLSNVNIKVIDSSILVLGSYSYFKDEVDMDNLMKPIYGHQLNGFFATRLNKNYDVEHNFINPVLDLVSLRSLLYKIAEKEDENNAPVDWHFRVSGVYKSKGVFVFNGEVYRPKFGQVSVSYGTVPISSRVFTGYEYAGFVTFATNESGKRIWDVADNFDFSYSTTLETHSSVIFHNNKWNTIYRKDKLLLEKEEYSKNELILSNLVESSTNGKIYTQKFANWYKNHIIRFGFEGKESINSEYSGRRKLFVIEKR
jgi:hypothetical protein